MWLNQDFVYSVIMLGAVAGIWNSAVQTRWYIKTYKEKRMGMFDYIEHEANCRKCGEHLTGFQSKDGPCDLNTLRPEEVDSFYTNCSKCGERHDFTVSKTIILHSIQLEGD